MRKYAIIRYTGNDEDIYLMCNTCREPVFGVSRQ